MAPDQREGRPLPGAEDIKAVLEFLPIFESPDFVFGEWRGGERVEDGVITMPYFALSDEASRFHSMLYDRGFIRPFNWGEWKDEAERYVNDPTAVQQADLETVCKLFTTHVRQDRFCEGHLAAMYDCGHLVAVLHRLRNILGKDA